MIKEYPYKAIKQNVYEINEFDGVSMFLVIGDEKALLVDAGIGIGDIHSFIQTLTDKPVEVLLTHNHRDHVGNAPRFKKVHMSSIDIQMGSLLRPLTCVESRLDFAHNVLNAHSDHRYPWVDSDIELFTEEPEVVAIEDGFQFDLGGRIETCYLCPGHTPGSMVIIDNLTGFMFCGDCCNNIMPLGIRPIPGLNHVSVEEALEAMQRLWRLDFNKEGIFNAHPDFRKIGEPLLPNIFPEVMNGMQKIMTGECTVQKQWIQNINTVSEVAILKNVMIQFHSDNIFRK